MSLYILDTDTLTLFRDGHAQVCARVATHPASDIAATIISVEEQLGGWYALLRRAGKPDQFEFAYRRLAETIRFYGGIRIEEFTRPAINRYGQLLALRLNVGRMDLRIAAIALEAGATVATRNRRDFGRVPGLNIEDWSV
jgi:tRNA(fMet)-specific endonuclease VapC